MEKPFPGVINFGTTYLYTTYAINVGNAPFIQIDFDSISANTFVSAYQGFYAPNSTTVSPYGFDNRWLGDPGTSGNFFNGTDPLFFNVKVIPNSFLIVVIKQHRGGRRRLDRHVPPDRGRVRRSRLRRSDHVPRPRAVDAAAARRRSRWSWGLRSRKRRATKAVA